MSRGKYQSKVNKKSETYENEINPEKESIKEKNDSKSFLIDKLTNWISIFTVVIIILSGINAVGKYIYYGINLDLFTFDSKYIFTQVLWFVLIWLLLLGIPILLYLQKEKDISYTIFKGFFAIITYLVIFNFYNQLIHRYYNNFIPISGILVYILMAWSIYFTYSRFGQFLNKKFTKEVKNIKEYSVRKRIMISIKLIELFGGLINTVYIYLCILCITLINILGIPQPNGSIEYSTISIEDQSQIVLFRADDKLFVADYKVDDEGVCIIYTKKYRTILYSDLDFEDIRVKEVHVNRNK